MPLKSSRQSDWAEGATSIARTTGSGRTAPRRVALSSRSFTTAFASAMRPLDASQRGDSGMNQRNGIVSTEGTSPTTNIAFHP